MKRLLLLLIPLAVGLPLLAQGPRDDLLLEVTPSIFEPQLPPVDPDAEPGLRVEPFLASLGPTSATLLYEMTMPSKAKLMVLDNQGLELISEYAPETRIHEWHVRGLTPGTPYRYRLVDDEAVPLAQGEFTTWPADPERIRFLAYGDTRTRPDEHRKLAEQMAGRLQDHLFLLHSGDLVADGRQYEQWKTQFLDPIHPLQSRIPVLPVVGNHERNSELYRTWFDLPDPEWYYGLRVGPVHVIAVDLYKSMPLDETWRESEAGQWLLAELERAEAAPYRIVMVHTPLYSLGPHGKLDDAGRPREAPMRWAREELEPLLREHGVQLVLSGHDHVYERSTKDGLVMITSGGGGAPLYDKGPAEQNPYSEVFDAVTHYLDIDAGPEAMTLVARDAEGEEIDRVSIAPR